MLVLAQTAIQSLAQSTYQPYTFTTLAGGGGFNSPHVPGTAARFLGPTRRSSGQHGHIYVADLLNHAIRKMTPSGTNWVVTTLAGLPGSFGSADGIGSAARFNNPTGVAVDSATNIYVADTWNHTIRKVTITVGQAALVAELQADEAILLVLGPPCARAMGDSKTGQNKLKQALQMFSELKMPRETEAVRSVVTNASQ